MPLKKNLDFSTGDFTQWSAGELGANAANGAIVDTSPMCADNDYYYSFSHSGSGSEVGYAQDAISTGYKAFWGKFKFRINDVNIGNTARPIRLLDCNGTAADEFTISVYSDSSSQLTHVEVRYRDSGGNLVGNGTNYSFTFVSGQVHTFDFMFKRSGPHSDDGIIKVWVDDTLVVDITNEDIGHDRVMSTIQLGVVVSNLSSAKTIDVGCLQLSTNGDYTTGAYTYHVDYDNGDDSALGTSAAPFKTALMANEGAVSGDTIKLASVSDTNPHRLMEIGQIDVQAAGSANGNITFDGNGQWFTATKDYSDVTWVESGTADEWYADVSDIAYDPQRIYVCTRAAWNSLGMAALDSDSIRTAGTAGSLSAGEYDYDAVNDRIVYKAAAGETLDATMSTLHIEVPMRVSLNDDAVLVDTAYQHVKNLTIFGAVGSNIVDSTSSAGSIIDNVTSLESWGNGIHLANAIAFKCTAAWARNASGSAATGIHVGSGAGSVLGCVAHNNANDGISFNDGTGLCLGNLSFNNGYEDAGDNSGIEATGSSNAVTIAYNTCVGNRGAGILWNQGDLTSVTIANNICAYNGTQGLSGAADGQNTNAEVAAAFAYNAAYGNSFNAFYYADPLAFNGGSTAITPSNTVTADPLFTTVDATAGQVTTNSNRTTEDYRLQSGTPCEDTTDVPATPVVDYYWLTGNGAPPTLQTGCAKARRGKMGAYR